jgi:hypothetical protein
MMNPVRRCGAVALFAMALAWAGTADRAVAQLCVQLNGATYRQNFNSLPASGASNIISAVPIGFSFSEAGSGNNVTFAASDGALSTNNTYSYGSTGNSDRALGELGGNSFQSTCGACFVNNTGLVINSMSVSYAGEQWRLGAADGNTDRLDFQFSTTATALNDGTVADGTWIDVNSLDFASPTIAGAVGAKDGNAAANRTAKGPIAIIPGSGVPQGATFFFRWLSLDLAGAEDGLAIDDFVLSINPTADFNLDTDVDGDDFLRWQRGNGTKSGASVSVGDGNRDSAVDPLDLTLWRKFFAGPPFTSVGAAGSVPEPAGAAIMAVVVGSLAAARRRGQSGYVKP